jgi:hypothetical protein
MLPAFIKQEREMRLAAEKVAAEKEAKRSKLRNIAKVTGLFGIGEYLFGTCLKQGSPVWDLFRTVFTCWAPVWNSVYLSETVFACLEPV